MAINPAALLPSKTSKAAEADARHKAQPVVADLDEPVHIQPLHSVVKVQCLSVWFTCCLSMCCD